MGLASELPQDYITLARSLVNESKSDTALQLFLLSNQYIRKLVLENFNILSEKEKEDYLRTTERVFQRTLEFSLFFPKFDSIRSICYDNELLLKGLLLNSSSVLTTLIEENPDSAFVNTYWKLVELRKQIAELHTMHADEQSVDIELLEKEVNETEHKLLRMSDKYAYVNKLFQYHWKDIKENLADREAAIEFVRIKHVLYNRTSTDSCSYAALIITNKSSKPEMIPLCSEQSLLEVLKKNNESDDQFVRRLYKKESNPMLYKLIWEPIEDVVREKMTVYLSPTGLLHQIAFAAIPVSESVLLSDKYDLHQLSSTRILADGMNDEAIPIESAVIFGGINYETNYTLANILMETHHVDTSKISELMQYSLADSMKRVWGYLPGTEIEAMIVDTVVKKVGVNSRLVTGSDATEEYFKETSETNGPDILHIATHGFTIPSGKGDNPYKIFDNPFVKSYNPLFRTGLLLAGANRAWSGEKQVPGIEDGILTAYEVSNLNLRNTQLVVLSACETGLGETKGSEGVYGLQRAFKAAGVRYILMTLWSIPDEQTVELMTLFYTNLTAGKSIRESFSLAQNEMKKKYPPYYWAGFVLIE